MCLTEKRHTIQTGVVRLNEGLLDLSILDEENVALAAVIAEDGAALEAEVERLGELAGGVTQEADLFKIQCQLWPGSKNNKNKVKKTYTALAGGIEGISPSLGPI
jgi:hypothetical protein